MMNKIRYLVIAVLTKLFRRLNIACYYETRYGVKNINRKRVKASVPTQRGEAQSCSPSELYLGVDGLRDAYTFVGVPCSESPHYELMRCCDSGTLTGCKYVELEQKGALDGRDTFVRPDSYHLDAFCSRNSELKTDVYNPVRVYVVDGTKYIADGKHRAALLAYQGKTVRYEVINLSTNDLEYMKNMQAKMRKNPEQYTKNLQLIEKILAG